MRIVFTGGSGKAGKHVVPWLKARGHEIFNLDLKPLDCPDVNTLITDVTDSGRVFNAVNDTITANEPTDAFLKKGCPNTPITRDMGRDEAPLSNRKARKVLGFREEHDWRQYV